MSTSPCTTAMALAPAALSRRARRRGASASCWAAAGGRVRLTTSRGGPSTAAAQRRLGGAEVTPWAGSATTPAMARHPRPGPRARPSRHGGPRRTPGCRRGVDDPDPGGVEGGPGRPALLGEHGVGGGGLGQRRHEQHVRAAVALGLQLGGEAPAEVSSSRRATGRSPASVASRWARGAWSARGAGHAGAPRAGWKDGRGPGESQPR